MISRFIERLKTFETRRSEFGISRSEQLKAWLRFRIQAILGVHRHFFSFAQGADYYVLRPSMGKGAVCENGLLIPPHRLWFGYAETEHWYLETGQYSVNSMIKDMQATGFPVTNCTRILDFGCAAGRMIRWLKDIAEKGEVWGVDVSAEHIAWCTRNLSPPFNFATTTEIPHLPFDDRYFDFIYAASVFTHIDDLAAAWLQELRRVLRPGGRLYATIHDEHLVSILEPDYIKNELPEIIRKTGWNHRGQIRLSQSAHAKKFFRRVRKSKFDSIVYNRRGNPQVFFNSQYFTDRLAVNLKTVSILPEAQYYQTAVILERSATADVSSADRV
jgi:SAM-dependent methyltransferase